MKRLYGALGLLFIMILPLAGCEKPTASSSQETKAQAQELVLEPKTQIMKDMQKYAFMSREQILAQFGEAYEIIGTGAEGVMEGYHYADIGLTFTFDDDNTLSFINCDEKVDINGAHAGMSIVEVMNFLGKVEVKKTWIETPEHDAYYVTYWIGKCRVEFHSYAGGEDHEDTIVYISSF